MIFDAVAVWFIIRFLDIVSPDNDMLGKMRTLFSNYPEVDLFLKTLFYISLGALCPF